jgi:hypothetical protein
MWPVTNRCEELGAKILYLTTMSDYPFDMALVKKGRECRFLQDYSNETVVERKIRALSDFYGIWMKRCFEWDGMRHWPLSLQSGVIKNGVEEYFCLEQFIEKEKPDMFMALHERNRWGKLIGHLSVKYGIPYVTFQEGDYYEDRISFSGHTEYTTALLLWGKDTEEMLTRLRSTPEKFVLTGNTHLATIRETYFSKEAVLRVKKELNIPLDKKVVLFLVGLQWGVVKDSAIWEMLLSGLGDDVVKIFKWHPKVTAGGFKKDAEPVFKEKFPSCIILHTYDPYNLIQIADYCITLGKTTLAVEAVSFGKPLFSLPGRDSEPDHYAQWGISQPLWPPGNYEPLYNTIKEGVPANIQENVDRFLNTYFYKNNTLAIEKAVEVISHIFESRQDKAKGKGQGSRVQESRVKSQGSGVVNGRVSFIIPSGNDQHALLATLTSLSQNVKYPDWEVVIVINDENIKEMLSGISGDIKMVDLQSDNISSLYNKGAEVSTGEYLIFMKPGIVYFKDEGLIDAMKDGVAGMPLKNADMTPYCLGIGFDFNHVPYMIKDEGQGSRVKGQEEERDAVGGGLISMHRKVFEAIGGFDEGIANHLMEADICLSAKDKGCSVKYLPDCLGFVFRETFVQKTEDRGQTTDDEWKTRIRFFAKWCGKLPKDDDYIKFAGDLLKV